MNAYRLFSRLCALVFLLTGLFLIAHAPAQAAGFEPNPSVVRQGSMLVSDPEIVITDIPRYGWPWQSEPPEQKPKRRVQGQVHNIVPPDTYGNYYVACYIYVPTYPGLPGDQWWIKPTWASPKTTINADGTWKCDTHTGGYDEYASKYRAYLFLKISGNPPALPPEPCNLPTCAEVVRPAEEISSPPETTIVSCPTTLTSSRSVMFSFYSSHTGNVFYCTLDSDAVECGNPKNYENLAVGQHLFSVYAKDRIGTIDPTPASCQWEIVDAVLPGTPVLLSPLNDKVVDTLRPTFDWKDSTGADHYQIQVFKKETSTPEIDEIVTESVYTPLSDLLPGVRYYWRVKAYNLANEEGKWSRQENALFRTPLAKPVLTFPACGSSLPTDRPDFDWEDVDGATHYIIQVALKDTFKPRTFLVNATVKQSEYMLPGDLPQNKVLYWRVKAKNSMVIGRWSDQTCSFTSGNPPTVPVLVWPPDGALLRDYAPRFIWRDSKVPDGTTLQHYQIQVDDNKDFSSPVIDTTTPISEFTPLVDLASNTKFYWRVKAFNLVGVVEHYSAWSATWSFRTVILKPQSLTVIPNAVKPLQPIFDWDNAAGTGKIFNYSIQVSTRVDFSALLINGTANDSSYSTLKNLPSGKTIYWRVRVNGINGPSAWSKSQFVIP